jgi:hypothetical protein
MRKDNQEYRSIVCHYTKSMACEPLQMRGKVSQFDSCQVVDAPRRLLCQSH